MWLKRENNNVEALFTNRSGAPRKIIGSIEIEAKLLKKELLYRWAALTINDRCVKVREEFGFEVNRETLRMFYKRNGV